MRRLTIVQLLPALHSGGVERSTLEIADALVAAGHRSVVVSAGGRLVAPLEAGGSEHVALAIGAKSFRLLAAARGLRALLRELRPDIVHVRSRLPAWCLRWALRGLSPRPRTTLPRSSSAGVSKISSNSMKQSGSTARMPGSSSLSHQALISVNSSAAVAPGSARISSRNSQSLAVMLWAVPPCMRPT